jgi:hypothetical protein
MSLSSNTDATKQHSTKSHTGPRLAAFPVDSIFTSTEQMQRFELLRLAFFVLKLRKLNEQMALTVEAGMSDLEEQQFSFQRNLLQHVIFQQILTLTKLDAREQAMQIISACHNK